MVRFFIDIMASGYGKGTYIVKDSNGRIYPSGGLLKTPLRAKNHLAKIQARYAPNTTANRMFTALIDTNKNKGKKVSAQGGSKGEWKRHAGEWESKGFAEMDVESLIERGYKARLNSTSKPVKTPFGTIKGKRWYAEKFTPDGAVDFRRGKWMKKIDKNGGLGLENLTPVTTSSNASRTINKGKKVSAKTVRKGR